MLVVKSIDRLGRNYDEILEQWHSITKEKQAWYHDGVHFCVENDYMVGVAADKFAPSGTLSRAMIVTMLWRMEGSPVVNYAMSFEDVAADQWYGYAKSQD